MYYSSQDQHGSVCSQVEQVFRLTEHIRVDEYIAWWISYTTDSAYFI